jgi:crotonobetainyl-CoA:carnitine CoA-transferase CaiB-like acyl-CoA transferase
VIEIRPPGGEITRRIGPFSEGQSAVFAELNRGKRSLIADLRNERDQRSCQGTAGLGRERMGIAQKKKDR